MAWQVYADELLERGARLGSLLARELALSDPAGGKHLAAFQDAAKELCVTPPGFSVGWMLGHARTLRVTGGPARRRIAGAGEWSPIPTKEFPRIQEFLRAAACSRLQSISLVVDAAPEGMQSFRSLIDQLPTTCTRLELDLTPRGSQDVRALFESIPVHIKQLSLAGPPARELALLLDDRFDEIDLREAHVDISFAEALARSLEPYSGVTVRLGELDDRAVLDALGDRAVLGIDGDALFVHEANGSVFLLRRWTQERLQDQNGVIPARSQLTRSVLETFGAFSLFGQPFVANGGENIVRRGDGSWSARVADGDLLAMIIDEQRVRGSWVPFRPGSQFELNGQPYRFSLVG